MKILRYIIPVMVALLAFTACYNDDGNYNYLTEEEVGVIQFDTTGLSAELSTLSYGLEPNEHINVHVNVKYPHPERLRFRWFYLTLTDFQYKPVQDGNALVYPKGDTISYKQVLDWTCNLKPGQYRFYCMAEDSVSGQKAYYAVNQSYIVVSSEENVGGLYLLTERDGNTDIEVYQSDLMLIYGNECKYQYYSKLKGHTLPGKPRFIRGTTTGKTTKDGYLVATDQGLYRLAADGMETINDWNTMFYNTPEKFNPQKSFFTNNCDFLLNDGKLHVLYANMSNDIKYSDPIAGDYEASPFLMINTTTTWRPVTGAINAWQVLYDKKNKKFRPYYSQGTAVSNFKSTVNDATVDANNVSGDVRAVFQGGGNYTCVITNIDNVPYLYRYCFYNVVDNGNLSAAGAESIKDLSGCTGIQNAKLFASNTNGYAFYYATDKAVYSFSASSGSSTSNTIYECSANEEVTAMYSWGSSGGGWPTSDCILWIAVWDKQKQEGKLLQYEMDINYGTPTSMWGPMFGAEDNPTITTGWGRIVDMTNIDAE